MKKILMILPAILFITTAWAQDQEMDKKMPPANSLDGRAFKITLTKNTTTSNDTKSGQKEMSKTTDQNGKTDNYDSDKMNDKESMNKESMHNKSGILRFENGFIKTSFMNQKNSETAYTSSPVNNDIITFSSSNTNSSTTNMNSSSSNPNSSTSSSSTMNNNSSCTWSGTVEGKNIRGSMSMTKSDGTYMSFTFSGTETNSKDLGMK